MKLEDYTENWPTNEFDIVVKRLRSAVEVIKSGQDADVANVLLKSLADDRDLALKALAVLTSVYAVTEVEHHGQAC